ncbi:putative G-protein coupled receptor 149 [Aulostomus maculatus]
MSTTHQSPPAPNQSYLSTATYEQADPSEVERQIRLMLFGLCVTIAAATVIGGVYSLLSLLRMRRKTSLCLIVASMSVDDLLSVIPLSLFMLLQWERDGGGGSAGLCALSGLLYVFQGVSSNMKACLIAAYTFYVTKRFGVLQSVRRPLRVMWAIAGVWAVSLAVSVLPLCGWGSFTPAFLGCFPETESFYILLLFFLYSICFCGLLFFFIPLTYQLLCSREPQRTLLCPSYLEMARGLSGSAPLCDIQSFSRETLNKSFGAYNELSPSSRGTGSELRDRENSVVSPVSTSGQRTAAVGDTPVVFAQKRFSMILAFVRVILWMPMMTLVLVRHAVNVRSSSLETLSFFLTLLAPAVTPLFVLSKRWIHMPCGCFINCKRDPTQDPSDMKRRFEFNLSFQQGYGVYKLSHAAITHHSPPTEKPAYHSLFNCDFPNTRLDALESGGLSSLGPNFDFSTTGPVDSSSHADLLEAVAGRGEALADCPPPPEENHGDGDDFRCVPPLPSHQEQDHNLTDTSSVFEGSERRLSHEECRKIELTDWEWCRSKSERTPRQRSSGGLSIPLCAFQGTVSLQAPTGKTLSLSTYEVSSDGLKISPNNAKKVEVYRSKSVGHEPSADDAASQGQTGDANISGVGMGMEIGLGIGSGVGDTNVKIHLEVLEICDNEEAMDSVSIISNISQSSTHARSPSLRYSRRENRFVSCDLGETASYSLLIPGSGNPESETINITIPDTVEAHRQNSRRQTQGSTGYREEIQLLNEAYRKQTGDTEE